MEVRGQKSEFRWFTAILAAYTIHLVSIWNDYNYNAIMLCFPKARSQLALKKLVPTKNV